MSFKSFSTAQNAPSKGSTDDKSKNPPAASQTAVQSEKSPADVGPPTQALDKQHRRKRSSSTNLSTHDDDPYAGAPMTVRTTRKTVTFAKPFLLDESGDLLPADPMSLKPTKRLWKGCPFLSIVGF